MHRQDVNSYLRTKAATVLIAELLKSLWRRVEVEMALDYVLFKFSQ